VITTGKGKRFTPGFSPDGDHLAFIESTSTRTRDIWKAAVSGGPPTQVTRSMGRVDPAHLTEAREIFYFARDNLKIPGMMWLPPDFDPDKKYPVLVRLHGHPGQWSHDFRMMTQYFINKGFVAIAPNPRGSDGFGQGFHDLHTADWGGEEFHDVMGVIPFMESLGYVDMDRKATWGGSGGGFMSMTVATKAPDVFQAQVIRAPVTDWKVLVNERHDAVGRAWTATRAPSRSRSDMGGSYAEIPEEYDMRSPINFVEAVQVPQLLFHGLRDTNVLPRQSEMWVDRMRELGKGDLVEFITYPDEDHGLRRYKATIRDRLERMSEFFSEHVGYTDPE
jgi:dipeptidyl aminopeptidase/acylaminoacyl peptidase